jgi:threonine aldolase
MISRHFNTGGRSPRQSSLLVSTVWSCRDRRCWNGGPIKASFASSNVVVGRIPHVSQRRFSSTDRSGNSRRIIDLRSDTVTLPTPGMMQAAMTAPLGDDVYGEDPTVTQLEIYAADLLGKEQGLYVPTGTMANLLAILAHCNTRASEIIIGASSHICMWEGGGASNLGGVHTLQLREDPQTARLEVDEIRDVVKKDTDDHWPETKLLCLENTHNMLGGVALPASYMNEMGRLAHEEWNISCHVDGARLFNAAVAQQVSVADLCRNVDSVSVCCSKGLGAPLGSVLVGSSELIRLARRARKRCGGGMRQAGVVAAMGLYALQHHIERLAEDHIRAQRVGHVLKEHGFYVPREGQIDTNVVYFALPQDNSSSYVTKEELGRLLYTEYGIRIGQGYSRGGEWFRIVIHMGINDDDIDRTADAILQLVCQPRRK